MSLNCAIGIFATAWMKSAHPVVGIHIPQNPMVQRNGLLIGFDNKQNDSFHVRKVYAFNYVLSNKYTAYDTSYSKLLIHWTNMHAWDIVAKSFL